jgi:D-alanyl-lipoteichoic acid acyltransferase DltB (MBOAT superfamily)
MLFTEFRYLIFFAVVFVAYWAMRSNTKRKVWLLAASYAFYGSWDWRFLGLIILSTVIDYVLGARLALAPTHEKKRALIITSVVVNLGILGFFKYFNFFAGSFVDLAAAFGLHVDRFVLNVVLPVGVSFYTFQSLSYTIDIYRGRTQPAKSFLDFAVAVAFFPHLVAGPIMRARDYLGQLQTPKRFADVDIRWALVLFLLGFFKKACVSDLLSPYADAFFSNPSAFGALDAWLGTGCYAAQIYCDFSGYSDMGIASAGMLGYRLCTNFNAPYLATDITDFWRRWHISLSSWLRDYLYIPLGGNRKGRVAAHLNLMITMLLGGLWHGASWNFVLWGAMHGLALVVHKEWTRLRGAPADAGGSVFGWALTMLWVLLAWVPFRAPTLGATWLVFKMMGGRVAPGHGALVSSGAVAELLAAVGVLFALHYVTHRGLVAEWWRQVRSRPFAVAYAAAWAVALALKPVGYVPFIYFQF